MFLSQESLPSRELEPPLLTEPGAPSTAKATDSNLPDEHSSDIGPSSGLAPSQSKQETSEDDYEVLRKRLDALRARK